MITTLNMLKTSIFQSTDQQFPLNRPSSARAKLSNWTCSLNTSRALIPRYWTKITSKLADWQVHKFIQLCELEAELVEASASGLSQEEAHRFESWPKRYIVTISLLLYNIDVLLCLLVLHTKFTESSDH